MRLSESYVLFLVGLLSATVSAFTEEPLENISSTEQPQSNVANSLAEISEQSEEPQSTEPILDMVVESQGHGNAGERKARQFGYLGFGFPPLPPPPPPPYYGGSFGGGFSGGFGGGFGGGFQRTRVVTRTRVVNRVRGGGFYGGGGGGGYFG